MLTRQATGIPVSALAGLPVAGLKDSSGDPDRLLAEVARYPGRTYVGKSSRPWYPSLSGSRR